jgi:uncharacterized protein (DUF58 family)
MSRGKNILFHKVIWLGAFALLLFTIGIIITVPVIFASIPIVILLGIALLTRRVPQTNVKLTRSLDKYQMYENEVCRVKLRVTNFGSRAIELLQIRDLVPSDLESIYTQNGFTLSLDPGESSDLFYELKAKSFGMFNIGPVRISSSDSLGFMESEATIDLRSRLIVLPQLSGRLSKFSMKPRKTKPWAGEIASRKIGQGADFYGIRDQIPRESMRRVNWRASARMTDQDKLLVNEYNAELGLETMIIIDARRVSEIGLKPHSAVSYSVRGAISIADRLLKEKNRVGLVTIAANAQRISLGYGRRQFNRIMLSLLNVKLGESWAIENLDRYVSFFYPNISQIIFFSSLIDNASLSAVSELARIGFDIAIISPNPLDFGVNAELANGKKTDESMKIAEMLAKLSRNSRIEALRSAGAFVIDWHFSDPIDQVIETNARVYARQLQRKVSTGK